MAKIKITFEFDSYGEMLEDYGAKSWSDVANQIQAGIDNREFDPEEIIPEDAKITVSVDG